MLQTLKSTFVLGTLVIVGYGVHVILNKPPGTGPIWNQAQDVQLPEIDFHDPNAGVTPLASTGPLGGPSTPSTSVAGTTGSSTAIAAPTWNAPASLPLSGPSNSLATSEPPVSPSMPTTDGQTSLANQPPANPQLPNAASSSADLASQGLYPSTAAETYPAIPGQTATIQPTGWSTSINTPATLSAPNPSSMDALSTSPSASHAPANFSSSTAIDDPSRSSIPAGYPPPMHAGGVGAIPTATSSSFDEAWMTAQQKLQSGQLVSAHLTLSLLYHDDSLSSIDRDRMITLLDQLAGTVIYSRQHLLDRPYQVQPTDTWESLGRQFQVPPLFLCRVNGLPETSPPPVGQPLKVVNGPFRAEVSISRRELTLFLGRYYAGRFNIGIGRDLAAHLVTLEITEKSGPRPYIDRRTGQTLAAGAPDSPYGQFWIGLRDVNSQPDPLLGIHDCGSQVDASDTRGCITVSSRDADDLQSILIEGARVDIGR